MACFLPQETANTSVAYCKEINCELPVPPGLRGLRKTAFQPVPAVNMVTSDEINPNRQVSRRLPVGGSLAGPVPFEFSFAEFDELFEGALQSEFTKIDVDQTDLSVTATDTFTIAGGTAGTGLKAGLWFRTTGFLTAANNGIFKIQPAGLGANTIKVESAASKTPLVIEAAPIAATKIYTKYAFNGKTRLSYFFEAWLETIGKFFQFKNCSVNTSALTFASESKIAGNFGLLGIEPTEADASVQDPTLYGPSKTGDITNTTSDMIDIRVGRTLLNVTHATELSINTTNNMAKRPAIGSFWGVGNRSGDFEATGTLNLYLVASALQYFREWITNVANNLDFKVKDPAGNIVVWDILRFKWTAAPSTIDGRSQDMFLKGAWGSEEDPETGKSMLMCLFPKP